MQIHHRLGITPALFIIYTLQLLALPAGTLQAAGVNIELSGGDYGCCLVDSNPESVSGSIYNSVTSQHAISAEAYITTGVVRGSAETNAWYDGDGYAILGGAGGSTNLNVRFTNTDDLTSYEITPGNIGLAYDASYFIDQQNAQYGSVQFQLRLDATLRDGTGALVAGGDKHAWINHIVNFNETSIWDNQPATTAPNLKYEQNGGIVEAIISPDGIAGTLTFDSLMLMPDYTLDLHILLNVNAEAGAQDGITDIAMFPSAAVDAENTVQLFFNNPGLTSDTMNPLEWPSSPTIVPLPAAFWLFGSGLIGLVAMARRRRYQAP